MECFVTSLVGQYIGIWNVFRTNLPLKCSCDFSRRSIMVFKCFCDFFCWSILVVLILAAQIFVWQSHSRVNKVLIKIQSPKIPSAGPHSAKLFPIWTSFLNLANPTQLLNIQYKFSKSFINAQNPTQMLKILHKCSKSYTIAQQPLTPVLS